jgi:hypothetical protein
MTMFDTRRDAVSTTADLAWSNPDFDLWVATVGGDYAGMVEFTEGHFVVRDAMAAPIATCSSIPEAQATLAAETARRHRSPDAD